MKKATYEVIRTALINYGYDNAEVFAELDKEINRGAEIKAQKAAEYDAAEPIVIDTIKMAGKAVTLAKIYESCKDELPTNFSKSRVQYGLTHYWQDKVTKVEGKVNSYRI